MTLLDQAKASRGRRARGTVTDEEIELVIAFFKGIITGGQFATALKIPRTTAPPVAARILRNAMLSHRVEIKAVKP